MMPKDAEKSKLKLSEVSTTISTADAKWWETAEDHRFALEVLQLKLRRKILKFLDQEIRTREEIEKEFGLSTEHAEYHLAMLEKGLVVERIEGGYRSSATGRLYLEKVEGRR
jgi:DNA-binding transcriptional ArsR family regulator